MEWVSVCLRLVFVPSEAEKVGKFPSAGAKLLPSSSFHNFCGFFACLVGNAEFDPPRL